MIVMIVWNIFIIYYIYILRGTMHAVYKPRFVYSKYNVNTEID